MTAVYYYQLFNISNSFFILWSINYSIYCVKLSLYYFDHSYLITYWKNDSVIDKRYYKNTKQLNSFLNLFKPLLLQLDSNKFEHWCHSGNIYEKYTYILLDIYIRYIICYCG